jgi:uncharacterized membrane protein
MPMQHKYQKVCHWSAASSLILLIALCVAWELFLAPLRPGGSWLVLKVVPLLLPLIGVLKRDVYTMQWSSMLILLYVMEGIVRATSDKGLAAELACVEIVLALIYFLCILTYLRPIKRTARRLAQQAIEKASK